MKKLLIIITLMLLILNCLAVNIINSENDAISIEKTRANIIVDINGNGEYTSIQDAIDNANLGDTIYVWEGEYDENIVIDKTLSLIGNGSEDTTIDGRGMGVVVYIDANWVNLSGFDITRSVSSSWYYFGIQVGYYSNNNTIANNTCSNNEQGGIRLERSRDNIIENNIFTNNWDGIQLFYSYNNVIKNNKCLNNVFLGILLSSSNKNIIVNNTCSNNDDTGIYLSYLNNNTILNNNCSNNGKNGIYLEESDYNIIKYNDITNNGDYGFYIDDDYCKYNKINHNKFINNNGGGVQGQDYGTNNDWDYNYWGDWLTPDNDGDGIVDNPYILYGGAQDNYPLTAVPYIINLLVTPTIQKVGGYVNISLEAGDLIGVEGVFINITGVENYSMSYAGNYVYYYNTTYSNVGTYNFTIWVISSENINSINESFEIEDVTIDDATEVEDDLLLWLFIGIIITIVGIIIVVGIYEKVKTKQQPKNTELQIQEETNS